MPRKLAFNSYTVRDKLTTSENIERTFTQLRDIGYEAIELDLDRLLLHIDAGAAKDLFDRVDLRPFSAHVSFDRLESGFDLALTGAKTLGLDYIVVPTLPRDRFCKDTEGFSAGARMLASFGEKLNKSGMKFAYHNHAVEFQKFRGKTAMDIVFNEPIWKDFLAEIDVYWVQYGGGDPAEWIRKYRGRVPLVHIKDMGIIDDKPTTVEVGEGNLNFPEILEACRDSAVKWYIVEQDDSIRDPVESLRMSKNYLNGLGIY